MQGTQPHSLWQGRSTVSGSRRLGLTSTLALAALVAVFAMAFAASAQATPNTAKAWGSDVGGALGCGGCASGTEGETANPVTVSGLSGVIAIDAGGQTGGQNGGSASALLENGTAKAWGLGEKGQLGDGNKEDSSVPVAVCAVGTVGTCPSGPFLEGIGAVSAGANSSLDLLSTGKVVAAGSNLGNGTTATSADPVEVAGLSEVKAVTTGEETHYVVLKTGKVMAWGNNPYGQLGNGTTTESNVPVALCAVGTVGTCPSGPFLEGVEAVAAGPNFALALLESGEVVSWGENRGGKLGNGTTTESNVPVAVSGLSGVKAIQAGGGHSLALLESGKVMAWGDNAEGALGTGSSTGPEECGKPLSEEPCSKKPVEVTGLSGVTAIAASGGEFSLALLSNGRVMAWGSNSFGVLGNGELGHTAGPEHCGPLMSACATKPVEAKVVDVQGIAASSYAGYAFGPPPTVTAVEPDAGLEGKETSVTISGEDFTGATAVEFQGINATSFTVNSDTSITATSPAQPGGTVDVTVTTGWGTSATSPADQFTYVKAGAAPTVTKLKPHKGPLAGGRRVTIKGTGFNGVTAVKFGSVKATSFTVNSPTSITAVSPAGKKAKERVAVTVTTPDGTSTGTITKADRFKYVG